MNQTVHDDAENIAERPVGADDGRSGHVSAWRVDLVVRLFLEYFADESLG